MFFDIEFFDRFFFDDFFMVIFLHRIFYIEFFDDFFVYCKCGAMMAFRYLKKYVLFESVNCCGIISSPEITSRMYSSV